MASAVRDSGTGFCRSSARDLLILVGLFNIAPLFSLSIGWGLEMIFLLA